MTSKQVSVRLSATGGRQVRAELEGVGEAGARGFGRLSREMEAANQRMASFWRRTNLGLAALAATIKTTGALMIRSGRRAGERAGRAATRLENLERTNVIQRQMLDAAARRPRNRDDLVERLRDGRF